METTRKQIASIAWNFRKQSRQLPPLVIPDKIRKAAEAQGWKFRDVNNLKRETL